MSTRVQKGGTVFRPVTRPRPRAAGAEARQTPSVPDFPTQTSISRIGDGSRLSPIRSPSVVPSTSLPPVADSQDEHSQHFAGLSLPSNTTLESQGNTSLNHALNVTAIAVPLREGPRPPALQAASQAGTTITVPSRTVGRPIMIGSSRNPSAPAPPSVSQPGQLRTTDGGAGSSNPPRVQTHLPPTPITVNLPDSTHARHPLPSAPVVDMSQIDPSLIQFPPQTPVQPDANASTSSLPGAPTTIPGSSTSRSRSRPIPRKRASNDPAVTDQEGDIQRPTPRPNRRRTTAGAPETNEASGSPTEIQPDATDGERPAKRRRPKKPAETATTDGEEDYQDLPDGRKRRKSSGPHRPRTRPPSVPPFDPDADPGEELDPTVITMSALCDDTGRGRVSSKATQVITNHAAWRATNREKRARLKAIMEAKKYGRNIEEENQPPAQTDGGDTANPDSATTTPDAATQDNSEATGDSGDQPAAAARSGDDFDYTQNLATSRYNVQVRIGAHGETIIDEQSLFVDRDEEEDTQNYTHVEESDTTKFVNSLTYSKKTKGSRWSAEETELFFNALSQFGENYELISYVLPGRDRKACKNKFKAEDKKNPARITFCLNNRTPFDIQTLARMTGKDFSGPTPIIRAPAPLQSRQLDRSDQTEAMDAPEAAVRKQSQTPALGEDGEEILGNVDDLEKEGSLFDDADDLP